MSQYLILQYLADLRATGDDGYHLLTDICTALNMVKANGNAGRKINCLYAYGFLDIKVNGLFGRYQNRRFRIKSKYISEFSGLSFPKGNGSNSSELKINSNTMIRKKEECGDTSN